MKLTKIIDLIRRKGMRQFCLLVVRKLLFLPDPINGPKAKALKAVINRYDHKVAFGPFKGMKFQKHWWGGYDLVSQLLGVYEQDVVLKLEEFCSRSKSSWFIDIGAADGYFAVGLAYSKLAESIFAFEIEAQGQRSLHLNAKENHCSDKISIKGEASLSSIGEIVRNASANGAQVVILIDIEGAEFTLLSEDMLKVLKDALIVVELHPFAVADGSEKEKKLIARAAENFRVSKLYKGGYDPNQFEVLNDFTDDERLLALSEGRLKNPKWLILEPCAAS